MHFLMTALGSYGDVYPIAGLGRALRQRGHEVSIISNPHFQSVIESTGAEFLPLGTHQEYQEFALLEDIWHPIRGPLLILKHGITPYLRELYALIESQYRPGQTVLVAHCLDLASRVFQEKHGAPMANAFFAPLAFRSFHHTPKMAKMLTARWVPRSLRRFQFWLADRLVIDRYLTPTLNELRQEQGLPPVKNILGEWCFSPQLVLGLFPEWFAPTQPDWPRQVALTGFPLWDQPIAEGLPSEVDQFLRGGEPPIVFTPGSAMAFGHDFFQAAVDACVLLDRRGILLTKYPEQIPANLPPSIRHFDFIPFSQLLPRAAAVVHHGGIGSCAQGLAAGLPQLLMPMAYDQPDNAARLKSLGVAEALPPKKFRGPAVARALDRLLTHENTHQRCHHWAQQCNAPAALSQTCELLEGLRAYPRTLREGASGREIWHFQTVLGRAVK